MTINNGEPGSVVVGSEQVSLQRVACTSPSSCVAVGSNQAQGEGVVVPITNGVPGSAQLVPGTATLSSVACDPSGACVATGSTQPRFAFGEGVVVPISGGAAGAPQLVPSTAALLGVTCPASGSCVSVGYGASGAAVVPIEAGVPQVAEPVAGTNLLTDIDCNAPGTCTAVGFAPEGETAAVPVTNGVPGAAQTTPGVPFGGGGIGLFPNAVACPSAGLCLVAGETGVGAVAPIVGGAPSAAQPVPGTGDSTHRLPGGRQLHRGRADLGWGRRRARLPAGHRLACENDFERDAQRLILRAERQRHRHDLLARRHAHRAGLLRHRRGVRRLPAEARRIRPGRVYAAGARLGHPYAHRGLRGPSGTFSGGGIYYEPGSATATLDVTCATTISGEWPKNLVISNPGVCLSAAHVSGSVTVRTGASLSVASSTITGSLAVSGASALRVCASTVEQSVKVNGATGYILIGDRGEGENLDGCRANTIKGALTLSKDSGGATAVGNSVGSIKAATVSGAGGYPFELAPRLAPNTLLASGESTFLATRQSGAQGQPVDGIECSEEQFAVHFHAHLAIFAGGQPLAVPEGIGMVGPLSEFPSPYGPFAFPEEGCLYWVHTHTQDGIIHMELPGAFTATLGDFFDLWGQPLSSNQLGPRVGRVTAFVNGVRYGGNPRNIVLGHHTLVQLDLGTPVIPPQPFEFSASL